MTCDFMRKTGKGLERWNQEWGNGMLEYWNVGELGRPPIIPLFQHSSIPFLTCGNFGDKKGDKAWLK